MNTVEPTVINRKVFEYLRETAKTYSEKNRCVSLLFETLPCINIAPDFIKELKPEDRAFPPKQCIILQIIWLHTEKAIPVCTIFYRKSFRPQTVAHLVSGILHDLLQCGLIVVASVSTARQLFIEVIAVLCGESDSYVKCSPILQYKVDSSDIIHFFDFDWTLAQIRDMFTQVNYSFTIDEVEYEADYGDVLRYMNALPDAEMFPFLSNTTAEIKPTKKLFNKATVNDMQIKRKNCEIKISNSTMQFCEFFAEMLSILSIKLNKCNEKRTIAELNKAQYVLSTMKLRRLNLMEDILITPEFPPGCERDFNSETCPVEKIRISDLNEETIERRQMDRALRHRRKAQLPYYRLSPDEPSNGVHVPIETRKQHKNDDDNPKKRAMQDYRFTHMAEKCNVEFVEHTVSVLIQEGENEDETFPYIRHYAINNCAQVANGMMELYDVMKKRKVGKLNMPAISLNSLRTLVTTIVQINRDKTMEAMANFEDSPEVIDIIVEVMQLGYLVGDMTP